MEQRHEFRLPSWFKREGALGPTAHSVARVSLGGQQANDPRTSHDIMLTLEFRVDGKRHIGEIYLRPDETREFADTLIALADNSEEQQRVNPWKEGMPCLADL